MFRPLVAIMKSQTNIMKAVVYVSWNEMKMKQIMSVVSMSVKFSSSQRRPDRLWGPPSLLSNGYRELFPQG
jgi:hypothetical protein